MKWVQSSQKPWHTTISYIFAGCWPPSVPVKQALDTAPIIAIAQPEGPAIIAVDVDDVAGPLNH